jgi:hypothetical protein
MVAVSPASGLRSGNSELLGRLKDGRRHTADDGNGRAVETAKVAGRDFGSDDRAESHKLLHSSCYTC